MSSANEYAPPPHIAVVRVGKLVGDREVAFWVEGVRKQMQDDVAPAWGMPPPGVFLYDEGDYKAGSETAVIAVVDDDLNDDAAGFHTFIGGAALGLVDLHQSAIPSRTLSHEVIELWCNQALDRWVMGPDGLEHAVELCDPVGRTSYMIPVEMFGEKRSVEVSDFVLPPWFELKAVTPSQAYAFMSDVWGPYILAIGGYSIARTLNGSIVQRTHPEGALMDPRKLSKFSRTARMIRGGLVG